MAGGEPQIATLPQWEWGYRLSAKGTRRTVHRDIFRSVAITALLFVHKVSLISFDTTVLVTFWITATQQLVCCVRIVVTQLTRSVNGLFCKDSVTCRIWIAEGGTIAAATQAGKPLSVRKLKLCFSLMALTSQVMSTEIRIYVVPGIMVVRTVFYVCQNFVSRSPRSILGLGPQS